MKKPLVKWRGKDFRIFPDSDDQLDYIAVTDDVVFVGVFHEGEVPEPHESKIIYEGYIHDFVYVANMPNALYQKGWCYDSCLEIALNLIKQTRGIH